MKKKLLFIIEGLGIGGAEKSLLTILSLLDYSKYDVDLFLFKHNGELVKFIPKEVNLLLPQNDYEIFARNRKVAPIVFISRLKFKCFYHSLMYLLKCIDQRIKKKKLYIGWNHQSHFFKKLDKKYDVSIAYLERKSIYFNVDKVDSDKKIGFIHNDYSIYPYEFETDNKYFKYYDKIATVSDHCKDVLQEIFPQYKDKFMVILNMVSKDLIRNMANEEHLVLKSKNDDISIVTVSRLVEQKGIDIAINICRALINNGKKVKWYVVGKESGSGVYTNKLKKMIIDYKLENNFFLVGAQINPYKYMKSCDIYVQPSRFEGYGITVAEAKALSKVIIASDIPEFREQINDGVNGFICSDINQYVSCIEKIMQSPNISIKIKKYLEEHNDFEHIDQLQRLYEVL